MNCLHRWRQKRRLSHQISSLRNQTKTRSRKWRVEREGMGAEEKRSKGWMVCSVLLTSNRSIFVTERSKSIMLLIKITSWEMHIAAFSASQFIGWNCILRALYTQRKNRWMDVRLKEMTLIVRAAVHIQSTAPQMQFLFPWKNGWAFIVYFKRNMKNNVWWSKPCNGIHSLNLISGIENVCVRFDERHKGA